MSVHKLSAGDGYLYLLRSTANHDIDDPAAPELSEYYSEKGESPGRWMGRGVEGLGAMGGSLEVGDVVTEAHMKSLFGEGLHPEADDIYEDLVNSGVHPREAIRRVRLGRGFRTIEADPSGFRQLLAIGYDKKRRELGGVERLTDEQMAQVRDKIGAEQFTKDVGRAPLDAAELSGYIARRMRPDPVPVAGYDLTFSPVKSVSALWSIAPPEIAETIRQAHRDAVKDVMGWLEDEVIYTRRGDRGVRTVDTHGVLATAFEHRDSRAGDPDLHTHVAIANRVQDATDPAGGWYTLDGSVLYRSVVAASERYNTRVETILRDRLGVSFSPVARTDGLREVREIDGVSPDLIAGWSQRRSMIETRRTELAAEFLSRHGRAPTPTEAVKLAQQATIETRQSKHAPKSEEEQRAQWRSEAASILGSEAAVDANVWTALAPDVSDEKAPLSPAQAAEAVIEKLQSERATWQGMHVRAEAERMARAHDIDPAAVDTWVETVMAEVIGHRDLRAFQAPIELDEPELLRRADGSSVYRKPHSATYTSRAIEDAENRLIAHAKTNGHYTVPTETVEVALLEHLANGRPLNEGQSALVRSVTTSGRALQLVLAPAGAGKTTAMRVVADAWRDTGGTVIGLAPSASAGALLAEEMNATGDTLAKIVGGIRGTNPLPEWADTIDRASLIVIDEAGLAGTLDLETAVTWLTGRGASVRLVGDDRQLSAIGSGGVLRDIAREVDAVSLREVVRFSDPAEATITLSVREGDIAAAAWWGDRGRIHAGSVDAQTDDVVAAWWRDTGAGRDSLMLATTREHVRQLNQAARALRVADGDVDSSRTVTGRGNIPIGVGDQILARRNDRRVHISATHWLKNGDRFTVTAITDDGGVMARHAPTGRTLTLPSDYVASHTDLGYASTIHGAQGVTVDTSHTLLSGDEDRQALYVATSRGRHENHLWVAMSTDGSEHSVVRPEAIAPRTALEIVEEIIRRDGAAVSARTARAADADVHRLASQHIAAYEDARSVAIFSVTDPEVLARIDTKADTVVPGVTQTGGWDLLRVRLAELSLDDCDPIAALTDAADTRELDLARDTGAVMWWRLTREVPPSSEDPDLQALSAIPPTLLRDDLWGPYLSSRRAQVHADVAALRHHVREELTATQPRWTAGISHQRDLVERVAMWRELRSVAIDDVEPLGSARVAAIDKQLYQHLERRIEAAREQGQRDNSYWQHIADDLYPGVTRDPYWPVVSATLSRLDHAGTDAESVLRDSLTDPLPAERCGTALWWRIQNATHSDASIDGPTRLRPAWTPILAQTLTDSNADAVLAAPDWPAFVDVVAANAAADEDIASYLLVQAETAYPNDPDAIAAAAVLHAQLLDEADAGEPAAEETPEAPSPQDEAWYLATIAPDQHSHFPTRPRTDERPDYDPEVEHAEPDPFMLPPAYLDPEQVASVVAINDAAHAFWQSHYPHSEAQHTLRERFGDLEPEVDAGYAPRSWTSLVDHLRQLGFSDNELLDADLARYSRRGTLIDTYRDRLMLPVRSAHGEVIGFTGRRLDDSDTRAPKWMNGANSAAWAKSTTLYGIEHLTPDSVPVIVEGALDALAVTAATNGRYVGVAPLGTALTPSQVARLPRSTEVIVAFDADPAGRKATERAYELLTDRYFAPRVVSLPQGQDPSSLLTTEGPHAIETSLENATPLVKEMIDQAVDDLWRTFAERNARFLERDDVLPQEPPVPDLIHALTLAAGYIAAAPASQWPELTSYLDKHFQGFLGFDYELVEGVVGRAITSYVPDLPVDLAHEDEHARAQAALARIALRHGQDPKLLTSNDDVTSGGVRDVSPSYMSQYDGGSPADDISGSIKL